MNDPISPNDDTSRDDASHPLDGLLLDLADLRPGDILLFRAIEPDRLAQRVLKAIGSPYTHAAVYLGNHEVIEAGDPKIEKRKLSEIDKEECIIGVFRSQLVFSDERVELLRKFAEALIGNDAGYDWLGIRHFKDVRTKLEEELLELLHRDYGNVLSKDELERRSYFCSALVVACYIVSGVIGDTAQLAYKADAFSPADLHEDPTFGWFLGYVTSPKNQIPADDPLMTTTLWRDIPDARCGEDSRSIRMDDLAGLGLPSASGSFRTASQYWGGIVSAEPEVRIVRGSLPTAAASFSICFGVGMRQLAGRLLVWA